MAKESKMIDEKLSELYAQLKTLSSINEKSASLKEIATTLTSIGDERVCQIEELLTGFSKKTQEVVGEVEKCVAKLNAVLVDINNAPLVEEIRGVRENVSSNIKSISDGVMLVEKKLSDRMNLLNQEMTALSNSLSKNSTEVTNIKRNVSDYATQTKDGLTELDTTVRDRTGELDSKFDKGQSRQSGDMRQMKMQISDVIEGSKTEIAEAVVGCRGAVETCQGIVKSVRTFVVVVLIVLFGFSVATFPFIKAVWTQYLK